MKRSGTDNTFTGYTRIKLIENFGKSYNDINGVRRWQSNDRVPFEDMLTDWMDLDLISQDEIDTSLNARKDDLAAFFTEYREAQAARSPEQIAEERAMAKAALGDVTVVDIITGERF